MLDDYSSPWVRKQLWSVGCYDDENEHIAMQAARIAVWELLLKDRDSNETRENFTYYSFGIYKKKTLDLIRKISRNRANMNIISMDEPMGDDGKKVIDYLPSAQTDWGEREEMCKVYTGVFKVYCNAFLNSKTFPPRALALYYARVLPHLIEGIPDSKAASAKWAFNRMGKMSVGVLEKDSEHILRREVDGDLCWGESFTSQLEEDFQLDSTQIKLKDVIYTSQYNTAKIEDWSEYMHKATLKIAMDELIRDRELMYLVREYVSEDHVLGYFLKGYGGETR